MSLHKVDKNWPLSIREEFSRIVLKYSTLTNSQKSELLKAIHTGFWNYVLQIQLHYAILNWKTNATLHEIAPLEAKLLYFCRAIEKDLDDILKNNKDSKNVSIH
jgi:hypothetical protein